MGEIPTVSDTSARAGSDDQLRTSIAKDAFLVAFVKRRGIIARACLLAGISRDAFYEWKNNDPKFAMAVQNARINLNDEIEDVLLDKALIEKDGASVRFYLASRHPDYKNSLRVDSRFIGVIKPYEQLLQEEAMSELVGEGYEIDGGADTAEDQEPG